MTRVKKDRKNNIAEIIRRRSKWNKINEPCVFVCEMSGYRECISGNGVIIGV